MTIVLKLLPLSKARLTNFNYSVIQKYEFICDNQRLIA